MPLVLFLLFLVVPIVELAVILEVGQAIGVLPTVALLLAVSIAGAALVRREGLRAWRRFRLALDELRLPTVEVVDGALILLGGALMLTPGFVTDAVGLLLVIPPTRAVVGRLVRRRVRVVTLGAGSSAGPRRTRPGARTDRGGARGTPTGRYPTGDDEPYDVEVVAIERDERRGAPDGEARPPTPGAGPPGRSAVEDTSDDSRPPDRDQ